MTLHHHHSMQLVRHFTCMHESSHTSFMSHIWIRHHLHHQHLPKLKGLHNLPGIFRHRRLHRREWMQSIQNLHTAGSHFAKYSHYHRYPTRQRGCSHHHRYPKSQTHTTHIEKHCLHHHHRLKRRGYVTHTKESCHTS